MFYLSHIYIPRKDRALIEFVDEEVEVVFDPAELDSRLRDYHARMGAELADYRVDHEDIPVTMSVNGQPIETYISFAASNNVGQYIWAVLRGTQGSSVHYYVIARDSSGRWAADTTRHAVSEEDDQHVWCPLVWYLPTS